MIGERMSDTPWIHFVKSYGSAIYILPVAVVGFILSLQALYKYMRKSCLNITSMDEDEKTYKSYFVNPFDLGTMLANFCDRIWRDDTATLFKPNQLYDPTPF